MDPACGPAYGSRHGLWPKFCLDSAMDSRKEPASRGLDEMSYGPSRCDYKAAENLAFLACDLGPL